METGFNAPWLFNQFRTSDYYVTPEVVTRIKALNPQVLRFFGGSLGNDYDSTKPGYGFEQTQATENYLSRLSDLLAQMPGVRVSYVVNVYQALIGGDVNYWIDNMLNVLRKIPQIAYCEIGNEINISGGYMACGDKPRFLQSLSSFNTHVSAKAMNFLSIADRFIDAIREFNPDIKIGLPFANYPNNNPRSKQWNATLRSYRKHDAEIYHLYFTVGAYLEIKAEFDRCTKDATKRIWVTEWSYNHGNNGDKNLSAVGQAFYRPYFNSFPEVCLKSGRVDMICQHQLYGQNVYSKLKP